MRKVLVLGALSVLALSLGPVGQAQTSGQAAQPAPAGRGGRGAPPTPVFSLDDNFLQWRLLPSEKAYEAIDGRQLLQYVRDLAAISRRYRDAGHPQFWGRIIGSSADQDSAQWLMNKLTQIGLTDVHMEPIDLAPQWFPQSWTLTAKSGEKTLRLDTAQPAYTTPGTTGAGLDLEVVYAGLGSEADLIGRDLRGKAVLIFSNPMPGSWRHTSTQEALVADDGARTTWLQLAEKRGAAAIICSIQLPGNIRTQLYPTGTRVPTFSMGMRDGMELRDMIAHAPAGQPVKLALKMDVSQVPGLKSGTVWGTLKGATDERIYVEAHRDGWFEAATDNASGVATLVGVAEYFARVPQAQRRRTIVFIGTSGHHNSGPNSAAWLAEHHEEVFRNTALLINAEHTAAAQPELLGEAIRLVNNEAGFLWYGGGKDRPKLQDAAIKAFQQFGVPIYAEPENGVPGGEASRLYQFVPAVQASNYNMFFHSDAETPATVPAPGLAATTRAYVKIIEEVNKLDLKDLQPMPATTAAPNRPAAPAWTLARMPDGHPDFHGVWANNTVTPLQRPKQWEGKTRLTDAEVAELQKFAAQIRDNDGDAQFGDGFILAVLNGIAKPGSYDPATGNYNQFWVVDRDWHDRRTSIISDPADGKIPPMTPEGQKRRTAEIEHRRAHAFEDPEVFPLGERCVNFGVPRLQSGYNSYLQIVQSPGYVTILNEMAHDARIVPMDGRPHLPSTMRTWNGDPRGRWEGDTLVIDTTNFSTKSEFMGAHENLHLTEKFTRVSADVLNYEFTVDDSTTWTKPWTGMIPLKLKNELIYEYACHEGNEAIPDMLRGHRFEEREAAGKSKQ